jgi:predicted ester cyclase
MSEANKAAIRRLYERVYNQGDIDLIDEMYSREVELHIAGIPEDPFGPQPVKELAAMTRTAFPGIRVTIDDLIAADDKVVASVSFNGAFRGTFNGHSPHMNLSWWRRIDVYRLANGVIVEQWGDRDDYTLLQRLGVAAPPFEDTRPNARAGGRL